MLSCRKLKISLDWAAVMGHLNTDTLIFILVLIAICCFFLGHAMHNILDDDGYGAYGNMAVMWVGFMLGLYATSYLGYNMRDYRLAALGGVTGAFSLLGVFVLTRSVFRRFIA
jgi:hypothetical protein